MLTKKKIREFIEPLFADCNKRMVSVNGFDVAISIWYIMNPTALSDLIKILKIIEDSPYIKSNWDVWRDVGYYDSTDDIRMEFIIDKESIKKSWKKNT